jgi:hypothetical protein
LAFVVLFKILAHFSSHFALILAQSWLSFLAHRWHSLVLFCYLKKKEEEEEEEEEEVKLKVSDLSP